MTFGATPPPSPRPPTRSRARRFVPLGVAAWMVLEIWLLTVVAGATNGLTVFLLLVGGVIAGGYVIKRAGRRAWRNLTETLQAGGGPTAPKAPVSAGGGNTLPMLSGLLLMVPGLLSDALGLLCLFPPTAKLIGRRAETLLTRRKSHAPGSLGDAFQQARMHMPDGKVVQGEVIRDDEPPTTPRQDPPLTR
ncbi:FxsA family membrane protein [Streptomyces halobius]|uniref:FxsA family protein n=1 Tax=Streptomyces halobius TaxID=2879846 RepID=A0ABY4MJG7_9ACTN|nr:FxsA family membrane protein [Streptomyces halobius]UQA97213.1 FxsA family protein [Streptomyces halobius]